MFSWLKRKLKRDEMPIPRGRRFNAKANATTSSTRTHKKKKLKKRMTIDKHLEDDKLSSLTLKLDGVTFRIKDNGEWYTDANEEFEIEDLEAENAVLEAKNNMIRLKNELLLHNIVEARHKMDHMRAEIEQLKKHLHPHIHLNKRKRSKMLR